MVTPANYAAAVLPLGTTAAVIDPHEIGNVLGMRGIRYMVEASEGLPLRVYIAVPTCVPAVPGKESAGAAFTAVEISEMLQWPRVIAAAEVMDYIGVVRGNQPISDIVQASLDASVTIQGHSPLPFRQGIECLPGCRHRERPRGQARRRVSGKNAPGHAAPAKEKFVWQHDQAGAFGPEKGAIYGNRAVHGRCGTGRHYQ
jgi:hypothetical protein